MGELVVCEDVVEFCDEMGECCCFLEFGVFDWFFEEEEDGRGDCDEVGWGGEDGGLVEGEDCGMGDEDEDVEFVGVFLDEEVGVDGLW